MKTSNHNTRQNESGAVAEGQLVDVDVVNTHCFTYPLSLLFSQVSQFSSGHPFSSLFTVELVQPPCPGFFTCKLGIMLTLPWNIILRMNGITICERDLQWVEYIYIRMNEVMKFSITNSENNWFQGKTKYMMIFAVIFKHHVYLTVNTLYLWIWGHFLHHASFWFPIPLLAQAAYAHAQHEAWKQPLSPLTIELENHLQQIPSPALSQGIFVFLLSVARRLHISCLSRKSLIICMH